MKRWIGFLFALMLALPALQISVPDTAPGPAHHAAHDMAHHHGHGSETPISTHVHHDCIGCIAPIDRDFYRAAASPVAMLHVHDGLPEQPFQLALTGAPEPPPPRISV